MSATRRIKELLQNVSNNKNVAAVVTAGTAAGYFAQPLVNKMLCLAMNYFLTSMTGSPSDDIQVGCNQYLSETDLRIPLACLGALGAYSIWSKTRPAREPVVAQNVKPQNRLTRSA